MDKIINFIIIGIVILCIIGIIVGFVINTISDLSLFSGNKTLTDTNYKFNKALISFNNEIIEIDVRSWKDYDGEQIQIIGEDGNIYLVSSFNTILINQK